MAYQEDKEWATKYIMGPLTAPEPNEVDGPGTHFRSTIPEKQPLIQTYPSPPHSASPTLSDLSSKNPYASSVTRKPVASPSARPSTRLEPPRRRGEPSSSGGSGRRRGSSLGERYPGDESIRPLDVIRKETKKANRSPHLRKKHIPGADMIDSLDDSMSSIYHHEGPYDATLLSRNRNPKTAPVEALRETNSEALKATPRENIRDALEKHVPLQGTAIIPPHHRDMSGQVMEYQEGDDLMRDGDAPGGAYKRWDGVTYLPEDLKGKGEPSFSLERALKQKQDDRRAYGPSEGESAYEMRSRRPPNNRSMSGQDSTFHQRSSSNSMSYAEYESGMRRSNTTGRSHKIGDGLKRTLGSLRRKQRNTDQ